MSEDVARARAHALWDWRQTQSGRPVILRNFPDENDERGSILAKPATFIRYERKRAIVEVDGAEVAFGQREVTVAGPFSGRVLWAADNPLFTLEHDFRAPPLWMIDLPLALRATPPATARPTQQRNKCSLTATQAVDEES